MTLEDRQRAMLEEDSDTLFPMEIPPPVSLRERFGVPPFTIFDRRGSGDQNPGSFSGRTWQDRKRRWLRLGMRSELGRASGLIGSEESGREQGVVPIAQRSDRALEAMAKGKSVDAKRARQVLETRARNPQKRQLDTAPPPGGGGTGAWKGRLADGSMGAIDPKWDVPGTPKNLIPGAGGVGGAYDRSRPEGTLHRDGHTGGGHSRGKAGGGLLQGGRLAGFTPDEERAARARLNAAGAHHDQDTLNRITGQETLSGTSIFDPVLCELAYRWFTAEGMRVLDPFAGGSVRGIVAAVLQRHYVGVDLRPEQVAANRVQGDEISDRFPETLDRRFMPKWVAGDSRERLKKFPSRSADFLFSCPPYADLEVYSDSPADLSNMEYQDFLVAHAEIVREAARTLKDDRFAAWVISDVRDKRGNYRGLVHEVVSHFQKAGLGFYNEAIILDPVGSAAVRAGRIFLGGRKLTRMHQFFLVFVKGDFKRATLALANEQLDLPRAEDMT